MQKNLGLTNTKISDGQGDLSNYWDWNENDGYLSAGGITSNIGDMLRYARFQLDGTPSYLIGTHYKLAKISENSKKFETMNIQMDYIGAAWIGDIKTI